MCGCPCACSGIKKTSTPVMESLPKTQECSLDKTTRNLLASPDDFIPGVYKNGVVEIVPSDQGNRMMPSTVAFDDEETLVGEAAKSLGQVGAYLDGHTHRHSRTHSLTPSLTPLPHSPTYPRSHSLTHSLASTMSRASSPLVTS